MRYESQFLFMPISLIMPISLNQARMIRRPRIAHQGKAGISSGKQQSESGAALTEVSHPVPHGMYAPNIAPDPTLCK